MEDGTDRRDGIVGGVFAGGVNRGHRLPDLVANIRVDQGWGSAQLSGALKDVYDASNPAVDHEVGWAIRANAEINLPALGPRTVIGFDAVYADGASEYLFAGNSGSADGAVVAGRIDKVTGWAIGAGIQHGLTQTLTTSLQAHYTDLDGGISLPDLREYNIQGNIEWSPVSNFSIGAEVEYSNSDASGANNDFDALAALFRMERTF